MYQRLLITKARRTHEGHETLLVQNLLRDLRAFSCLSDVPAREKPETHGGSEQHFAHVQNFLHCLHHRDEKTASDIEEMHRATTTCHLANISYKLRRRVFWDAENERCYRAYDPQSKKFVGEDAEANAYLLREPRKPWSLES